MNHMTFFFYTPIFDDYAVRFQEVHKLYELILFILLIKNNHDQHGTSTSFMSLNVFFFYLCFFFLINISDEVQMKEKDVYLNFKLFFLFLLKNITE